MSNVKIAVRVRPFNSREKENQSTLIIHMSGKSTRITNPKTNEVRPFSFDYSFSSHNKDDDNFVNQDQVYQSLGRDMLEHAFVGYNTCIFAYGQTGSGKSYSMLGAPGHDQRGLIPRTCEELFEKIDSLKDENNTFNVEVSYMEIYCEKVKDLLNPTTGQLKVREHPVLGAYVENLSKVAVKSYIDIAELMELGNKTRTVKATNMNAESSRSHAVFTIIFTQRQKDTISGLEGEKAAKISLVDLAGSERASSTGATGSTLKEGAEINKSLTTLGRVIHALADVGKKGAERPPFRDSVLTYILKESLGGNSKTSMVAALSPADINHDETLGTLRFADRAKQIKCKATVNEDPNARMIRLLKEEIMKLRQVIIQENLEEQVLKLGINIRAAPGSQGSALPTPIMTPVNPNLSFSQAIASAAIELEDNKASETNEAKENQAEPTFLKSPTLESFNFTAETLAEKLRENEKLMDELSLPWKEKLEKAEKFKVEQQESLERMGIAISISGEGDHATVKGVYTPKNTPHLVNLNEDPLMSECLIYYLKEGYTSAGREEENDIQLLGNHILPKHCVFENENGTVKLVPSENSQTFVNGIKIIGPRTLDQGSRVILGIHHVFRFTNPKATKKSQKHSVANFLKKSQNSEYMKKQALLDPVKQKNDRPMNLNRESSTDKYSRSNIVSSNEYLRAASDSGIQSADTGSEYGGAMSDIDMLSDIGDDRSITPSSFIPFNFQDAQEELLLHEKDLLDELVLERVSHINEQLEEATKHLEQQRQEAEEYKQLYEQLLMMPKGRSATSSPEFDDEESNSELDEIENYPEEQKKILSNCLSKWREYRYTELRDSLIQNAVLLKAANSISVELRQEVAFQFILMTDSPYAPLPHTLALGMDCESEEPVTPSSPVDTIPSKTIVAVEVSDAKNGVTHIWSIQKLRQRLTAMYDMYESCANMETISPLIKIHASERSKENVKSKIVGKNPFHDRLPWYSLLGRGYVYMTHLLLPISMEQSIAIVTERGEVVGHLDVVVELVKENDSEVKKIQPYTVAFQKPNGKWHPKEIPCYPYRQNDLIERCYRGIDDLAKIIPPKNNISPGRNRASTHAPRTSASNHPSRQNSRSSKRSNNLMPNETQLLIRPLDPSLSTNQSITESLNSTLSHSVEEIRSSDNILSRSNLNTNHSINAHHSASSLRYGDNKYAELNGGSENLTSSNEQIDESKSNNSTLLMNADTSDSPYQRSNQLSAAKLSNHNKHNVSHQLVITHSPSPPRDTEDNHESNHTYINTTEIHDQNDNIERNNQNDNIERNHPTFKIEDMSISLNQNNDDDDSFSYLSHPKDTSSPIRVEYPELNNHDHTAQSNDFDLSLQVINDENYNEEARRGSNESDDMNSVISSETTSDYFSYIEPSKISAPHLTIGQYIKVKVKVLRLRNLSKECSTILAQFRFAQEGQDSFCSTIYQNDGNEVPMNHIHVYRIKISLPFLDYIKNQGLMMEIFGHYQQHPLHDESTHNENISEGLSIERRMSDTIPPIKSPIPVRSSMTIPYQAMGTAHAFTKYDVIMNMQICELNYQGDYIPISVNHVKETNGSYFIMQQGLQRRLVLSLVYDTNIELKMKQVKEIVIGRIRNQLEVSQDEPEGISQTLNVSSAEFIDLKNDSRTVFRIQAAWDTSLHHTPLLNKTTQHTSLVYATMSIYLDMHNCAQPACFTINFCIQITNRQTKGTASRFFESILGGPNFKPENNCLVGLYEVVLKRMVDINSRNNRWGNLLNEKNSVYVRGEENLKGWQPKGISLISEHQSQLARLKELELVEKTKHYLKIREHLGSNNKERISSIPRDQLIFRCLNLWKFQMSPFGSMSSEDLFMTPVSSSNNSNAHPSTNKSAEFSHPRCVPEVHDVTSKRTNPSVKRGYIQLSEYEGLWRKFYVVLKRPHLYLYYSDKDPIERDFINLGSAKIQFNQDQLCAQTGVQVFSLCTKYRGFLCKASDVESWIQALDPLTSGALVSSKNSTSRNSSNLV